MEESNKNNPFKTPEGYFESLNERLLDKLNEDKFDLPQEDGFTIPENYFDGLKKSVQEKIERPETKVIRLRSYRKYYLVAASVAAVLMVLVGMNWDPVQETTWNDLANTDIEAYFETNELGLTTFEIAEVLPVDELEISDILEDKFEEDDVIDYLNDHIEDIEDLNLEDYE